MRTGCRGFCTWLLSDDAGCGKLFKNERLSQALSDVVLAFNVKASAVEFFHVANRLRQIHEAADSMPSSNAKRWLQRCTSQPPGGPARQSPDRDGTGGRRQRLLGTAADRIAITRTSVQSPIRVSLTSSAITKESNSCSD